MADTRFPRAGLWGGAAALALALGYGLWRVALISPPDAGSYLHVERKSEARSALIFVHGLYGDGRQTFRAPNGVSWPTLVSQDPLFKDVDIYVYGYQSVWNRAGLTVPQLADEMNLRLEDAGIVERYERLIFVCHSMGGLVTRAFLARYRERTRDKVRFVYFFATPSSGSDFATLARAFLPTVHLDDLSPQRGETFLRELQASWLAAGYGRTISSYCAYETEPYRDIGLIVPWASALGLCNVSAIAIEGDHSQIVKPSSVDAPAHVALRTAFMDAQRESQRAAVKLVQGRMLTMGYEPGRSLLSLTFNGAVRSAEGAADVIQDVYGRLDTIPATTTMMMPIAATDFRCVRGDRELSLPFVMQGMEISCTIVRKIGDLSLSAVSTPGRRKLTISFETDEKRGHTIEYCFRLSDTTVEDLTGQGATRRFVNASCETGGV